MPEGSPCFIHISSFLSHLLLPSSCSQTGYIAWQGDKEVEGLALPAQEEDVMPR